MRVRESGGVEEEGIQRWKAQGARFRRGKGEVFYQKGLLIDCVASLAGLLEPVDPSPERVTDSLLEG